MFASGGSSRWHHSSSTYHQRSYRERTLSGLILMCNNGTNQHFVFGQGEVRWRVTPETKLFFYDGDLRLMHGIYRASSTQTGAHMPFPAHFSFRNDRDCPPLSEGVFKNAIRDNYYGRNKFRFELDAYQVEKLCHLFENQVQRNHRLTVGRDPSPPRQTNINMNEIPHIGICHDDVKDESVLREERGTEETCHGDVKHERVMREERGTEKTCPGDVEHERISRERRDVRIISNRTEAVAGKNPSTNVHNKTSEVQRERERVTNYQGQEYRGGDVRIISNRTEAVAGKNPVTSIHNKTSEVQMERERVTNYQGQECRGGDVRIIANRTEAVAGKNPRTSIHNETSEVQSERERVTNYQGQECRGGDVRIISNRTEAVAGKNPSTSIHNETSEVQSERESERLTNYHGQECKGGDDVPLFYDGPFPLALTQREREMLVQGEDALKKYVVPEPPILQAPGEGVMGHQEQESRGGDDIFTPSAYLSPYLFSNLNLSQLEKEIVVYGTIVATRYLDPEPHISQAWCNHT